MKHYSIKYYIYFKNYPIIIVLFWFHSPVTDFLKVKKYNWKKKSEIGEKLTIFTEEKIKGSKDGKGKKESLLRSQRIRF